jgi:hypothetical protein
MNSLTRKSIHILQPLQADPKTKAAKRVCFFPTQEKLKNKKFPPLQKNKTSPPHSPRQTIILTGYDFTQTDTATGHGRRRASANMVLPQWGVKSFDETFVRKQTAVHLLNFCAKNPPLRQYPNRYQQGD